MKCDHQNVLEKPLNVYRYKNIIKLNNIFSLIINDGFCFIIIFFILIDLSQLFFLLIDDKLFLKNIVQYVNRFNIIGKKIIYSDTNNFIKVKKKDFYFIIIKYYLCHIL